MQYLRPEKKATPTSPEGVSRALHFDVAQDSKGNLPERGEKPFGVALTV